MDRKVTAHRGLRLTGILLITSLLMPSVSFAQAVVETQSDISTAVSAAGDILVEISANRGGVLISDRSPSLDVETKAVVTALRSSTKNPVVISSDDDVARMIFDGAVERMSDRKFYRVDWNAANRAGFAALRDRLSAPELLLGCLTRVVVLRARANDSCSQWDEKFSAHYEKLRVVGA
jgi:hypothetical protein